MRWREGGGGVNDIIKQVGGHVFQMQGELMFPDFNSVSFFINTVGCLQVATAGPGRPRGCRHSLRHGEHAGYVCFGVPLLLLWSEQ